MQEVVASLELSRLRESGIGNQANNFIHVYQLSICRGLYPPVSLGYERGLDVRGTRGPGYEMGLDVRGTMSGVRWEG